MSEPVGSGTPCSPFRVVGIYAAGASAWIVLSDLTMAMSLGSRTTELWADIAKGLLFVAVSSSLLYLLLRRSSDREGAVGADKEAAQDRFSSAVAQLPFTFAIYDADRRFRFLNARGLLEARKSIEEVLGRRDEEVFAPEMVNAYLPVLNRAIETRKPQTEVVEIALPSGHVHLAYSFTPLLKADGSVREVLAVTNDMTVVVRNDRRVHQLNRTLAAISAANSVLVRATTEAALLQGFCDALVGATGHRLAWVGLVTPPDPTVRVAAYAGQGGGYLDGIEVRWDDTLKGRGPTGTCIRLGQPVICRDFRTEEQMAPWRERATECGMRSSVALPLLGTGGVLGAFTLYSSELDRFDDQEVRLLVELADDLAYGLAAVRREAALAAAEATLAHERGLRESIMTHSAALVYVVDLEGRFLYTNPALDRAIGQPEGCSVGKLRSDVIPAETAAAHRANDLEVVRSGRPIQFEEGNQEKGATQSYLTVKFPLRDATGKVFAVGGVSTNVTQLKQSEQALFESEERLRLALSAANQGIWDLDLPTGRAVVSPDYATMLGYAPEELHESHDVFIERLHPDDRERVEQAHRDYLEGNAPRYQVECRQRTKSGEWKWILSVGRVIGRDAQGRPLRMLGTHTDITVRKETETRLRESQERLARDRALLRALLDSIPDLIFFKDSNSVYLGCNRAFEAYSGMREDELVGKSDLDIVPREAAERYQMKDRQVLATGQPHRNEEWVPFKNGGGGEFETLKTPYYGPGGETLGLIGISRDIGERRRAEQALRESEVRFRAMFEEAPLGIALIDSTSGHFQEVNRRFAEIAGRPRTELQTVDWMSITHPEDVHGDSEQMALMNAGKISGFQMEKRYLQPDGRVVWISMTIALLKSGDAAHPRHLCMIEDITERRRDAEQLRLQGSALDAAANGIVITDAQGVIRWVNDAFTKLTGYSRAEVVGQNPRVLKSGEHPPGFYQALWQTILAGNVWHGELHNRRKDGTLYFEEMTIAPVRDTGGHVTHFIAIKQDITEKKNLEKRFLRAQRLEGIGLLAGGIAHDLNNVLAPILMGADMLKLVATDERSARQLGIIAQSARRGADIVKQVLTFARGIEGERVQLQPRHIVKEMAHMARETFPRNLRVHVDVPDNLWPVVGDPTQLHQVLLNLSVNARDAMPDGGELSYSARNVEVDASLAQANPGAKPGPHVVLRVKDSGGGMTSEVLDRVFEPFFTTKELGKGTGLGLSTALGIVRSHGGFVVVESQAGRGSTFDVYLPADPQGIGAAPVSQPAPVLAGQGELVLVVDDEKDILQVTQAMLEGHGYRVLTAAEGTAALMEFSQHLGEVKVLITDIMMPFMDGVQLIRAIRRLAPQLPVIASSGALGVPGQKDRTDDVKRLGVKQILHKPYSVETLLQALHAELHPGAPGA